MTDIPPSHAPDDPLDRAADALRRTTVPDGPTKETIARTLAALHAANAAPIIPFYRRKTMRYAWKIAVAAALAAGVTTYFTGVLPLRSPLAFAEVAAKLRDARTLTCKLTYKHPKLNEPLTMKFFFKEPAWERFESKGHITISDRKQHKTLLLDTTTKTALLVEDKKNGDAKEAHKNAFETIDWLRKLAGKKSESVGKKRIGDIEAEGFRTEEEGMKLTVWADPKTRIPVLIEMPIRMEDRETLATFSDFQFDPKLDDALFRLDLPEGYKLRKMEVEEDKKPEEDVVHLLRAYADKFDGKFPKSLSIASADWQTYLKQHWGEKKPKEGEEKLKGLPEPEAVQFVRTAMRIEMFLHTNKDHGYKADGVKLGDRDKIVFWYRPDKADKYRAVFGDLHVADVSADQLPEKPKK